MIIAGTPEAENAAQSLATAQGLVGVGSLGELSQVSGAAVSGAIAGLLSSAAIAGSGLNTLGLTGPTVSPTPLGLAYNTQQAILTNTLISQMAALAAASSIQRLGTGAMLANSGRRFLLSTYFGAI